MVLSVLRKLVDWLCRSACESTSVGEFNDDVIYELPYLPGARFRVCQGYGGSYSHTNESYYSLDFAMPEGTPICASRSGVVCRVVNHFIDGGTHPSFKPKANAIYILHPDDSIGSYVHLMHVGNCVISGDVVSRGQIIGYSGNTGWSGTPHLHFDVSDAISRKRFATIFATKECRITQLNEGSFYTKPATASSSRIDLPPVVEIGSSQNSDITAFYPELLQLAGEVAELLASADFDRASSYTSIDVLHDVHGLEVCGITSPGDTLEITRILLRRFSGWNARWIHTPNNSLSQGWIARIQRDRDASEEYWDAD